VAKLGTNQAELGVPNENTRPATAADLGLSRKDIHEAREVRDAEESERGFVQLGCHENVVALMPSA